MATSATIVSQCRCLGHGVAKDQAKGVLGKKKGAPGRRHWGGLKENKDCVPPYSQGQQRKGDDLSGGATQCHRYMVMVDLLPDCVVLLVVCLGSACSAAGGRTVAPLANEISGTHLFRDAPARLSVGQ